jgi:small-conductance mechanosensitive channel
MDKGPAIRVRDRWYDFGSIKIASEIRKRIYDSFQKNGMNLTVPPAQISLQNDTNADNQFKDNNLTFVRLKKKTKCNPV